MINYTSGQGLTMGSPFVFCSFVMLVLYAILPGAEAITMAHSVFFSDLGCFGMLDETTWLLVKFVCLRSQSSSPR